MTWNHRVIRHKQADEYWLGVHEVYYENGAPTMVTMEPVGVGGYDVDEIRQTIEWMMKSLDKPVLEYSDFEEGGKYYTE